MNRTTKTGGTIMTAKTASTTSTTATAAATATATTRTTVTATTTRMRGARPWLIPALLLAALPAMMGTECEDPLVTDSGFDIWCGDKLCKWQLDAGAIEKVPTWHQRDYGVELVGPSVEISQVLTFTSDDVTCMHVELLADVDDPVNVVLDVDFDGDGATIEYSEAIPVGAWTPVKFRLATPTYFHGVAISVHKSGAGHAALAQLQVGKASDCVGSPPPTLNRPTGAACETVSECTSGACIPGGPVTVCAADGTVCASDSDCPPGPVDNSCTSHGVAGRRCQ